MQDQQIIQHLRQGDTSVFREVYAYYPMIRKMVLNNSGSEEDAKDLFHNALIVFYKNIRKPNFELTAKISSYLYAICDKSWKKKLTRDKSRHHASLEGKENIVGENFEYEEKPKKTLAEVIKGLLDKLGDPCKKILLMHEYQKYSMQEIADEMGYLTAHSARNQKYKCLEKLKKMVSPELKAQYL